MQVILLERVEKLGQMGDEVRVKDGFARNYLLPMKKALRATKANREYFAGQKAQLEAHNLERKSEAEKIAKKLDGKTFVLAQGNEFKVLAANEITPSQTVATLVFVNGRILLRSDTDLYCFANKP